MSEGMSPGTGLSENRKVKKLEEQEWNSVPGSSEPGALAWLVEYLPSIDKALTSISKTP